jgi:hypothetical protein
VTNREIVRAFLEQGWKIRYRGGNSVCTTPSDLDVIIAPSKGLFVLDILFDFL